MGLGFCISMPGWEPWLKQPRYRGTWKKKYIFPPIFSINVFFPHINISFMVNQWCLPPIFWCFIPPITGKVWDGRSYCLTNIINLVDHCCNECTKIHWSASLVQFRSTRCNLVLGLAKVPMSKFMGFKQGLWHEIKFIAGADTMPYDMPVISVFVSL